MAEGANWYVVHTYSGYENKVKANIEKTIENRKLEDQILEVAVPMQDVVEIKNGVRKQIQKKRFPGYVLINMVMNDNTWYVVRNTRGVTGFSERDEHYQIRITADDIEPFLETRSEHGGTTVSGYRRLFGRGRVAVLTPGHTLAVWENPAFQTLFKNAVRWAAAK